MKSYKCGLCVSCLLLIIMFSRLICVVAFISTSFFFSGQVTFHHMNISHFVYVSVEGHLAYFHLLAIVNSAAMNIHVYVFNYLGAPFIFFNVNLLFFLKIF